MSQKVIKVGNSYALTIPSSFVKGANIKIGDQLLVDVNAESNKLTFSKEKPGSGSVRTPEIEEWLEKFNKKYKKGLTELAKR